MKCLSPLTIKPYEDINRFISVPCGRCINCLSRKRNEWTIRIRLEELTSSFGVSVVTLTYNDNNLPFSSKGFPTLNFVDVQLWLKRFRKLLSSEFISLRYFICGEYGDTFNRPHYHCILFFNKDDKEVTFKQWSMTSLYKYLSSSWTLGLFEIDEPNPAYLHYCTKYALKDNGNTNRPDESCVKPGSLMSRKPALGSSYLTTEMVKYYKSNIDNNILYQDGFKYPLPRSFRQKIFNGNCYKSLFMRDLRITELQEISNLNEKKYENQKRRFSETSKSCLDYSRRVQEDIKLEQFNRERQNKSRK